VLGISVAHEALWLSYVEKVLIKDVQRHKGWVGNDKFQFATWIRMLWISLLIVKMWIQSGIGRSTVSFVMPLGIMFKALQIHTC
jgi:hypothetical protein